MLASRYPKADSTQKALTIFSSSCSLLNRQSNLLPYQAIPSAGCFPPKYLRVTITIRAPVSESSTGSLERGGATNGNARRIRESMSFHAGTFAFSPGFGKLAKKKGAVEAGKVKR